MTEKEIAEHGGYPIQGKNTLYPQEDMPMIVLFTGWKCGNVIVGNTAYRTGYHSSGWNMDVFEII